MSKPNTLSLYSDFVTHDCERVLVTLLRGLGPWKTSVFLVGGLVPRYLVSARPPAVPPHAGTGDVDVVVDLAVLVDTKAYESLEQNLKRMGFERAQNDMGKTVNWRWRHQTEAGTSIILEFLADDPTWGKRVEELPTKGNVSAVNIPHASLVFELHTKRDVTAELLGGGGITTETVAHADLVCFTCLKAFAFDDRNEPKDAHDLTYCLEYASGGIDSAVEAFRIALAGKHRQTITAALQILRKRFCGDEEHQGHVKDGPVAVARFEVEGDGPDAREARILRQRNASALVQRLLGALEKALK